jgi:hypothetical protein
MVLRVGYLNDSNKVVSAKMNELFYKGFSDEEITQFDGTLEKILKNLKECEE